MSEATMAGSTIGRDQAVEQIATILGINGGTSPATIREFWYQVAIAMRVGIPADTTTGMARQIFSALDEEWDEDYAAEGGEEPSLEAYETLYDAIHARATNASSAEQLESESESGDEDDDSIGPVTVEFDSRAETTQTDIDTTLNKIAKGALILNPDWQRNFVWKLKKQRRLIESILLGLPIPSLLLFRESSTGRTYVIDGRQRLESISRFRAPKPAKGEVRKRYKTFPTSTDGWKVGEKLNAAAGKYYDDLPLEFKSKFDTATLVLHTFVDLPADKLYQIFRRYNTGAEQLKAAEIRNAVYQASPLHAMMYRVAGEDGVAAEHMDDAEKRSASRLRSIMKNKTARYGAYDFVGRYFAFSYMNSGSVANATNEFMATYERADEGALRGEYVRALDATCEWYEYPLITPSDDGKFHAFLATIQMVSTRHMLGHIDAERTTPAKIRSYIADHWADFALETLEQKQNSTAFWNRQKEWIARLEQGCVIANAA
jgi:hypothetical protein